MKIVLLDRATLGECDLSAIENLGEFESYDITAPHQVIERCAGAQIVLTNKVVLDSEKLQNLKDLKLICITATGMNNVDLQAAAKLGIEVKNVAGYSTNAVAQHTLTMALNFLSNMHYFDDYVKRGNWVKSQIFTHLKDPIREIFGLKWGVIGLGAIGKRVAKLADAFGASVCYHSTSGKNTNSEFTHLSLDELLKTCDVISIHAPLNDSTKNLLDSEKLSLLKDGAILLNMGRGGIVNEENLAKEIKARIAKKQSLFFGADVLEVEPMSAGHCFLDSEISEFLLLTPHYAWAYDRARVALLQGVEKNIREFLGK